MTRSVCVWFLLCLSLAPAQDEHREKVEQLAGELAALGFPIDLDSLAVDVAEPILCVDDLDRQQDMFMRPSYFAGLYALRRGFRLEAGRDPADLRKKAVLGMLGVLKAYYQSDRRAIVFVPHALDELFQLDPVVAHELVHAYQDQQFGLAPFLAPLDSSLDQTRIKQCLIEGAAEAVALAVMLARTDTGLDEVDPASLDPTLGRMLSGEAASLPYSVGRVYMLERFAEGGWEALRAAFTEVPPSSEQVLHASKLGSDTPREIALPAPAPGDTLVHADTLGELELYKLLLELGHSRDDAFLAAAGWDGDSFQALRSATGWSARWRILCDRDEDARQLAAALDGRVDGRLQRSGRVLTWAWAERGEPPLPAALPTQPALVPADSASTAAIESGRLEAMAAAGVFDGVWQVPDLGLRLPVPAGFSLEEINGTALLMRDDSVGFRESISAVGLPNVGEKSLEALLEENRTVFEGLPAITLEVLEIREVGGRELLWIEYHGKIAPGAPPLHFLALLYTQGARQVVVTATMRATNFEALREVLEAAFSGARIDD